MKGAFITFEGCEGVGKSTQIRYLKDYLEKTGQPVVFTREPGGTPIAEQIRGIILNPENMIAPLEEAYLFAAARADHIENVIKPAVQNGKIVICDRFLDSSLAYQGVARGLGIDKVMEINKHAVDDFMPDCTVFLDMNPADSFRKRNGVTVEGDRMEAESAEFHQKVYEGFCKLKADPRYACIVPKEDRFATHKLIVKALKDRGLIR